MRRFAADLAEPARILADRGIGLGYHNHAFEFEPMGGSTPLETLLGNTDPKLLAIEMDLFWVSVAGQDPVAMLTRYKGRVPLVHLGLRRVT